MFTCKAFLIHITHEDFLIELPPKSISGHITFKVHTLTLQSHNYVAKHEQYAN